MKKLIAIVASIILLGSVAYAGVDLTSGYTSKLIEFGNVTTAKSVYTAGADAQWQSFVVGVQTFNSIEFSPFSAALNRVDLSAGYKLDSTLADVVVGGTYVHLNNANKFDYSGHWRPSVSVGKGFYSVTATYDTQSRMVNAEAKLNTSFEVSKGVKVVPVVFAGYTNTADALPKTIKAISKEDGYFGASLGVSYKAFTVGALGLRNLHTDATTGIWFASTSLRF